jgi:hypothetical protein
MWYRLRQVALVAHQLDPVLADFDAVLGLRVAFRDPAVAQFGLQNAVMPAGHQFVEVVSPVREGTTAGRYLGRRSGDGGYMAILQCAEHAPLKARVADLGIRKVVELDDHGYSIMQLHPRDTGGTFLEIDVQEGGEALDGPWMPAGPAWQGAQTAQVRAITAAEIQADDPGALAQRWAQILDLPVVASRQRHDITLDLGELRFVPAVDGRGEGLGGVEMEVADVDSVLAAADARGLHRRDDVVLLGGVRVRVLPPA